MTADWDEVKRLAADFQKAQLSSTLQKLSERNCVEIVQWLLQHHMLDLIFTNDGKEYLTPQHLIQEILGELYVHGGRANLVGLAKSINVDLAHINNNVPEILRTNKEIHLVLGQLVNDTYILRIAEEINEKLSQQGQISVSDLTVQYDLPAEFLQHNVIEKQLGKIIQGRQDSSDPKVFFTEVFIARSKAKVRGALAGLLRPTPVTAILSQIGLPEKLFFSLFDEVVKYGNLTSRMAGAQYIPHIYARSQNEWVNNFYKQNGYLEFDALIRLGISDYKNYVKRQLTNEEITTLNSCIISKRIIDQTDADIEECISSKTYIDIQNNLPSVFNEKDISMILDAVLTPQRKKQVIILDSFIISTAFIDALSEPCNSVVQEKAKQIVESGRYQQYQIDLQAATQKASPTESLTFEDTKADKREERRKKASGGKAGGGSQGRETKTKSTKKQTRGGKQQHTNDSDDESSFSSKKSVPVLEVITLDDVKDIINPSLEEEGIDELSDPLALYIHPGLNEKGLELAGTLFASTISNQQQNRRQTHAALQDQLNTMIGDVRLFEKGAKLLPPDVQAQLYKYLMKTICTDITNEIIGYLSSEYGLGSVSESPTNEQRTRLVNELPADHKPIIQALVKTLAGNNIEDFMSAVEEALVTCSMILKKVDKKKDRLVILLHKHGLLDQLEKSEDPALVLHLATLVIFEVATQNMIHASGRHVSSLLSYLKPHLSDDQLSELADYHDNVTLFLSNSEEKEAIGEKLKTKMEVIKKIASEFKKPSSDK